jgi:hypothetical protein
MGDAPGIALENAPGYAPIGPKSTKGKEEKTRELYAGCAALSRALGYALVRKVAIKTGAPSDGTAQRSRPDARILGG